MAATWFCEVYGQGRVGLVCFPIVGDTVMTHFWKGDNLSHNNTG